jgi:UDP-N-acetylmuramoylalanine--D-glutamate ligase
MNYSGKQILVLGLGRSGLAATRLLQQAGAIVTVADSGSGEALEQRATMLRGEGVNVVLGEKALIVLQPVTCNLLPVFAILSPGIDPSTPLVQQVVACGVPLVGELELAYDFCKCPIVAITGTNGKTTTTELTVAALQGGGLKTIACGNIGLPFSEAVVKSAELDVIVIEVSSFQLEATDRFHAHIAVWLNLSPNHLDRYASVAEYREAKLRVFRNQQSNDSVVIPKNFHVEGLPRFVAREITFSSQEREADFFFDGKSICYQQQSLFELSHTQLRGPHNAENMMAALAVGVALGIAPQKMVKAISQYRSLPHRCEVVVEQEGILWINDSKSTTLDAMEKALQGIEKKRNVILIAGGKNKGSSFSSILPLVQARVKKAILLGEMKSSIAEEWHGVLSHQVNSMEEAVQVAIAHAEAGDVVLLSPGTSSYDMFKNYEERGNQFKKAVLQLTKK